MRQALSHIKMLRFAPHPQSESRFAMLTVHDEVSMIGEPRRHRVILTQQ